MDPIYNYGISQEDAQSEYKALELGDGDSILCIASAGEMPLNLAAMNDVKIVACDTSINQIRLCKLKHISALRSDRLTAASFLGYMEMDCKSREELFMEKILPELPGEDKEFWVKNIGTIREGAVNSGRFEKYMRKVAGIGRTIAGKKNLYSLFDCNSIEEQKDIFGRKINGLVVNSIFRIAFHPWVYKNRGIDPAGLTHSGVRNIGEFFFQRFRSFCCNTLAVKNYFLQYTFFNRVLYPEALPEYLQPENHDRFSGNANKIVYIALPLEKILETEESGTFNKILISNIGDWMSKEAMAGLFRMIRDKTLSGTKIVMRYIHLNHKIPDTVPELIPDYELGEDIIKTDRYPFYSLVPINRK